MDWSGDTARMFFLVIALSLGFFAMGSTAVIWRNPVAAGKSPDRDSKA